MRASRSATRHTSQQSSLTAAVSCAAVATASSLLVVTSSQFSSSAQWLRQTCGCYAVHTHTVAHGTQKLQSTLLSNLLMHGDPGLVDDVEALLRMLNGHHAVQSFDVCLIIRRRSLIETQKQ